MELVDPAPNPPEDPVVPTAPIVPVIPVAPEELVFVSRQECPGLIPSIRQESLI